MCEEFNSATSIGLSTFQRSYRSARSYIDKEKISVLDVSPNGTLWKHAFLENFHNTQLWVEFLAEGLLQTLWSHHDGSRQELVGLAVLIGFSRSIDPKNVESV